MKKLFATALILTAAISGATAQSIYFENLYKDFEGNEDAMTMSLTGNLLTMASWFTDEAEDSETFSELGKSIDRMRLVMLEDGDLLPASEIEEFKRLITSREKFEELMTMRDGGETVDVFAIEADGLLSEIIMVMEGDEEVVIVDIWGKIKLEQVSDIVDGVDFN